MCGRGDEVTYHGLIQLPVIQLPVIRTMGPFKYRSRPSDCLLIRSAVSVPPDYTGVVMTLRSARANSANYSNFPSSRHFCVCEAGPLRTKWRLEDQVNQGKRNIMLGQGENSRVSVAENN
jgi:hypothetical protein